MSENDPKVKKQELRALKKSKSDFSTLLFGINMKNIDHQKVRTENLILQGLLSAGKYIVKTSVVAPKIAKSIKAGCIPVVASI